MPGGQKFAALADCSDEGARKVEAVLTRIGEGATVDIPYLVWNFILQPPHPLDRFPLS